VACERGLAASFPARLEASNFEVCCGSLLHLPLKGVLDDDDHGGFCHPNLVNFVQEKTTPVDDVQGDDHVVVCLIPYSWEAVCVQEMASLLCRVKLVACVWGVVAFLIS
jgi:hypothetical protein